MRGVSVGDWGFWIAALGMAMAVAASLIATVFQRRDDAPSGAAFDVQVYRAQLTEVDRDVAQGTLAAADAARLRNEISRRILEADRVRRGTGGQAASGIAVRWGSGVVIAAVLGGSLWAYTRLGSPGYADLPLAERLAASTAYRETRPKQAVAEAATDLPQPLQPDADFAALMAKLRQAVVDRPGDVEGLALLARNEAAIGNLAAARDAQLALMAAKPATVGSDHATLAELMIGLAGGYVSPEAEKELIAALELEPENGTALYYSGLMFAQSDRPDLTLQIWRGLLDASPPDAPWIAPIRVLIGDMAARAGVKYVLPEAPKPEAPGPTAADVNAAANLAPQDQRAMIQSMVDGLSDRLATDGGTAEDWARLITSLGVLGNLLRAEAIYAEARGIFAGNTVELQGLREAAVKAGIAP